MIGKPTLISKRQGIIFIISAPSGAGKTTLITGLRSLYPRLKLSVSCTTRARRNGEVHGRDYYFITGRQFKAMKARGQFAEWAAGGPALGRPDITEETMREGHREFVSQAFAALNARSPAG